MLGPFATASRRTPHCHSPGITTFARHHCCTPPAHQCPQQHQRQQRKQRQHVTEGTTMAPLNRPNYCSTILHFQLLLDYVGNCDVSGIDSISLKKSFSAIDYHYI